MDSCPICPMHNLSLVVRKMTPEPRKENEALLNLTEEQLKAEQADRNACLSILDNAGVATNGPGGHGKRQTLTTSQRIQNLIESYEAKLAEAEKSVEWAKMHTISGDAVHNCRMIIGSLGDKLSQAEAVLENIHEATMPIQYDLEGQGHEVSDGQIVWAVKRLIQKYKDGK